jgi:type II secretory pathway component PulJ
MRKKRRAFALLEVLIAIMLATAASFFLLEFEGKLVAQNRKQLQTLQKEYYLQEATVRLYEAIYTNLIPWKTLEEKGGSYSLTLSQSNWRAECAFTPVVRKTNDTPDHIETTAEIVLVHADSEIGKTHFRIFAMREERLNVETAPS